MSLKSNLGTVLGSKTEDFKNFDAQLKIRYSYKKVCMGKVSIIVSRRTKSISETRAGKTWTNK